MPRGIYTIAVDAAPWARTRLPDLVVTGEAPDVDGCTVRLDPGALVQVDVRDANGAPLSNHEVVLDDLYPPYPGKMLTTPTDSQGCARFDRIATGRYLVKTRAIRRCGLFTRVIQRHISVSSSAAPATQQVVITAASLRVHVTSSLRCQRSSCLSRR